MFTPFEQFEILFLFPTITFFYLNNFSLYLFLKLGIILFVVQYIFHNKNLKVYVLIRSLLSGLISMLIKNNSYINLYYYPFIVVLLIFLLLSNVSGMLPLGFTCTSQLIVCLFFSCFFFISFNLLSIRKQKINFLGLFVPSGAPLSILPFLFCIEIISYISRLFSIAIRLFANMLSGHTLLKILMSFVFILCFINILSFLTSIFSIIIIHAILFIEICIAFLQVYVFIVLISIYITDAFYITH